MLKEAEIRTFVEGTTNYFETAGQPAASVGSPYLVTDGKPGAYDYTGVIGISGARKGIVYFTAPHQRSYVIPINWRAHSAKLVVCLE